MVQLATIRLILLVTLSASVLTTAAFAQGANPGEKTPPAVETPRISLKEASSRVLPDYRPKRLLERVIVQGIVTNPIVEAADAAYLGIQDPGDAKSGLLLIFSGENKQFQQQASGLRAGSQIEAEGTINLHAGQAVLKPSSLRVLAEASAPIPIPLRPLEAARLSWLGLIVSVEGTVADYREAASGEILEFADGGESIRVFLPASLRGANRPLSSFHRGDRIRVRGLVTQFCLSPPYNRYFQLLVANANEVELIESGPALPPQIVPAAVVLILLAILVAWYLQQKARRQNRRVERILVASEALYLAGTPREVAESLRTAIQELLDVSGVLIYHYDPARKVLEKTAEGSANSNRNFTPHSFHIEEGQTEREQELAAAISGLQIRQLTNSLPARGKPSSTAEAESVICLPMIDGKEAVGAMLLYGEPGRVLLDEGLSPSLCHLANTAAHQLSGIESAMLREQIHRSEKLAVAGQLIHGVVTELNMPLEKIRQLSADMPEGVAVAIQAEVQRAADTVRRIVSVARAEQVDARPVDLRVLLQRLLQRLILSIEGSELELEANLAPEQLYVLGSAVQLDQVFANLLAHAESAARRSLEQFMSMSLNRIGRSSLIEIQFSGPFGDNEGPDFSSEALGMAISRGLMQSHGGDLRFSAVRAGRFRYEVELPSLASTPTDDFGEGLEVTAQRGLTTALLVEPELQTQRRLLAVFGENGHRLVPVSSIEEASELAEKLRFDVIFSCARPDGGTWVELFHRVHHRTMHFVLLTQGATEEEQSSTSELIDGRSASVLSKPIEEDDVKRLLAKLQAFREG